MGRYGLRTYEEAIPWPSERAIPPGAELHRAIPARPPSVGADVGVPFLQSLVTGGLLGGVVSFIAKRSGWDGSGLALWVGLTLAIAAVSWIILLADTRRLLWAAERWTGLDLNRDGTRGKPGERVVILNAAPALPPGQGDRRSLFREFIEGIPRLGTSQRTWEPRIGRAAYLHFRDSLIKLQWARWNNPNDPRAGWVLTKAPDWILERSRIDPPGG